MVAELALGTYRCRNLANLLPSAVHAGTATWFDTAPNYHNKNGDLETQLGTALRPHPDARVSTKVGLIAEPHRGDALRAGVITAEEAEAGYSLSSRYIGWQTARSNFLLRRRPEVVFVHNPEHGNPTPAELTDRLLEAFEALEDSCANNLIRSYGVATWNALHDGTLTIQRLLDLAHEVAGRRHHLRAVQLPVSLVMNRPLLDAVEGRGVLVDAQQAELDVFASAPLHGGELLDIVNRRIARKILPGHTPLQLLLGSIAATPVRRILLSASTYAHWSIAARSLAEAHLSSDDLHKVLHALTP